MNSTALGAEKENINFISEAHEKFYYEKIQKVREADVYHKALCYCIGMNEDTRRNVDRIYNFKTGSASAFSEELATEPEVLALLDKNKGIFK